MLQRDSFADPELIRSVYRYVSYRIGDGPDAEDATSETFERALRYRGSYDPGRGKPVSWLLGIARRVLADRGSAPVGGASFEEGQGPDVAAEAVDRITLRAALARLDERDHELLALRYGADLKVRDIGTALGMTTGAVKVALHRAVGRLREQLGSEVRGEQSPSPPEAAETL